MKAIEQYFLVVMFIMMYKKILTFKSVDETLVCDHVALSITLYKVALTYKSGDKTLRARSFGIFRNKNLFRNIFRLFCSWE